MSAADDDRAYDPTGMFGPATIAARRALVARLTALPQIQTALVTCDVAPQQIEGILADGRPYYFHARKGIATLALAEPGKPATGPDAVTEQTEYTHLELTERAEETTDLIAELLDQHTSEGDPRR